jgi:hypothetical protein
MLAGEMHGQPRPFRSSADAFPDPLVNPGPGDFAIEKRHNY